MIRERNPGSILFDAVNVLFLALFSFLMLYPLLYVFSVSISDVTAVGLGKVVLWPVGFDLTAYRITLATPEIWRAYANTVLYSATGAFLVVFLNSLTAFPLSYKTLYGRKVLTLYFTLTMFVGGGLIPTYLLVSGLGMVDTLWAIILPSAVAPWTMLVFRANFEGIPQALLDSTEIDGARAWTVYLRVVLPLSKPILATMALFSVVGHWNDFFGPLIYLDDSRRMPLQNYLRSLIVTSTFESGSIGSTLTDMTMRDGSGNIPGLMESIKMAAILVSLGPILIVYPFVQRFFVKGVMIGSIKG